MTIPIHNLEEHDFGKHSKTESNPRARLRLLILYQYSIGKATNDIAKDLCIHPQTARRTGVFQGSCHHQAKLSGL